jgi:hypothetical protein
MTAGMPGTGISGLFYVLLVCWMPIREVWLLAHRRSSLARWRFIGGQIAIVSAIAAVLYFEGIGLWHLANALSPAPAPGSVSAGSVTEAARAAQGIAPAALVLTPWLILFALVLTLQVLRRVVPGVAREPERA